MGAFAAKPGAVTCRKGPRTPRPALQVRRSGLQAREKGLNWRRKFFVLDICVFPPNRSPFVRCRFARSFVRSLARRRAASDKSCSPPNQKVQNFRQLRAQFSTRNGPRFEILPEGSGPAESGPLFRHSFLSLGHWNEAELGPFLTACPIPDQFKMAAGTRD